MKDHNAIRDRFSKDFQLDLSTELTNNLIATIQSGGYTPTHDMKMALLNQLSFQLWPHHYNAVYEALPPG